MEYKFHDIGFNKSRNVIRKINRKIKYGLEMFEDVDEEVNQMCNLGEGIAERAYAKGIEEGMQYGEAMLVSFVMDKTITLDKALEKTSLDKDEFMKLLKEAGYKGED